MCIPGYVGDADIACNLRKNFCLFYKFKLMDLLLTFSGFIHFFRSGKLIKMNLMAYHFIR